MLSMLMLMPSTKNFHSNPNLLDGKQISSGMFCTGVTAPWMLDSKNAVMASSVMVSPIGLVDKRAIIE